MPIDARKADTLNAGAILRRILETDQVHNLAEVSDFPTSGGLPYQLLSWSLRSLCQTQTANPLQRQLYLLTNVFANILLRGFRTYVNPSLACA